jgi:hypothetical protein
MLRVANSVQYLACSRAQRLPYRCWSANRDAHNQILGPADEQGRQKIHNNLATKSAPMAYPPLVVGMTKASELLGRAANCRDLAKRAARLASVSGDADSARLLRVCRELQEQAVRLEKEAAALSPPVTLSVGLEGPLITPDPPTEDQVDPEEKPKH